MFVRNLRLFFIALILLSSTASLANVLFITASAQSCPNVCGSQTDPGGYCAAQNNNNNQYGCCEFPPNVCDGKASSTCTIQSSCVQPGDRYVAAFTGTSFNLAITPPSGTSPSSETFSVSCVGSDCTGAATSYILDCGSLTTCPSIPTSSTQYSACGSTYAAGASSCCQIDAGTSTTPSGSATITSTATATDLGCAYASTTSGVLTAQALLLM